MVVVFSAEESVADEVLLITKLLDAGLSRFHLRKPSLELADFRKYMFAIPQELHARITIHQHHKLAEEFGIGGLHFPQKTLAANSSFDFKRREDILYSTGVHSLEDLQNRQEHFDLLFLSPVFASISKPGYGPSVELSIADHPEIDASKVVALGGIDATKLADCHENGFQHIALLGAIWSGEDPIATFAEIQEKWLRSTRIA